jgi:DNA-binding NarL/FixJ family response regulator
MSILSRILQWLGVRQGAGSNYYALDDNLHSQLVTLAIQENRLPEELAADLLAVSLTRSNRSDELWGRWQSLSLREQQVVALACLGYTNHEIANRMHVSINTIKLYSRNILRKFELGHKSDLRTVLRDWDFSSWDTPHK